MPIDDHLLQNGAFLYKHGQKLTDGLINAELTRD